MKIPRLFTFISKTICLLLILTLGTHVHLEAQQALTDEQKIELLIKSVQQLKDAQFYRNGSYYDAKTAAEHLRMKRNKAGKRIKNAQDFIDMVGSKSYMSGEEYHIKYSNGKKVPTKVFFEQKLKEINSKK